jgi:anti-sigma factor RsiW
MNCADWHAQIALYSGDDLSSAEALAVEAHLAECAACAQLAEDLRADRELLTGGFAEPDYSAMRRNVRAAIIRRRVVRWSGLGALAAAALVALLWRHPAPPVHEVVSAVSSAPTMVAEAPAPIAEPPAPHAASAVRHRPRSHAAEPSVAMLIATRDPQVRILLLQAKQEFSNE